ncbi:hypothetical protein D3C80_2134980 [compost metagenome]
MADFLEPNRPFCIVDFTQALDNVTHRNIAGRKAIMFRHHDFFGIRTSADEAFFQPGNGKTGRL